VRQTCDEMQAAVEREARMDKFRWIDCFKPKDKLLYRTILLMVLQAGQQLTGANCTSRSSSSTVRSASEGRAGVPSAPPLPRPRQPHLRAAASSSLLTAPSYRLLLLRHDRVPVGRQRRPFRRADHPRSRQVRDLLNPFLRASSDPDGLCMRAVSAAPLSGSTSWSASVVGSPSSSCVPSLTAGRRADLLARLEMQG